MAIEKKQLCEGNNQKLLIEFGEDFITEILEKEIDKKISEEYKERQTVQILLGECLGEDVIDELLRHYDDAGWEASADYDEGTITLI